MTSQPQALTDLRRGETKLPTAFWLLDWDGLSEESEWTHTRVLDLFTKHGFARFAPERRTKRTAGARAMQKKSGASRNQIHYVDDMASVPTARKVNRSREAIGADVRFSRRAVIRFEQNGEVVTTADFAPVFEPEYLRQQDLVSGHDIKKRWTDLILVDLNGYRWRPGAFFVQNADPYAAGMWRLRELATEFGATMSTIPIHDEGSNYRRVAERALDSLQREFNDLNGDIDEILVRLAAPKRKGSGVREETTVKLLGKAKALEQKLAFAVDKVGYELEDLQTLGEKRLAETRLKLRRILNGGGEQV